MNTPICDFVRHYHQSGSLRLHMPGHKGKALLGPEPMDITEIDGADSLYEADGIIAQSENNASRLFGCQTFYSTEGSSQCIRAMLYLVLLYAKSRGRDPWIAAGRNAHKTFLSAAALLDLNVTWLYPEQPDSYLSCTLSAAHLASVLEQASPKPVAVYLTSPDYLGNQSDIGALAAVCHKHQVLLVIDNAHGAYLKFLPKSRHPIDLGADLCCDSAHKTLPVLTGGAYLHLSRTIPADIAAQAKQALALFGSTSPSYLILQSLDAANPYLASYKQKLSQTLAVIHRLKQRLLDHGYCLSGDEPLKITIAAKSYGYLGQELADLLLAHNLVCEFADPDHLVLMLTPELELTDFKKLEDTLLSIPPKPPIVEKPPAFCQGRQCLSIREAMLAPAEILPISQCVGRIIAAPTVGCPPAVPILVCGELMEEHMLSSFTYYGIRTCSVIRDKTDHS